MSTLTDLPHHLTGVIGLACIAAAVWRLRAWMDARPVRPAKGAKALRKIKRK